MSTDRPTPTPAAAVAFFYDYAGYSWNPATETKDQGRRRCAEQLACAEMVAVSNGWRVVWTEDHYGQPGEMEALLVDMDGAVLASLGGIDDGESSRYRRAVAAELALEAAGGRL